MLGLRYSYHGPDLKLTNKSRTRREKMELQYRYMRSASRHWSSRKSPEEGLRWQNPYFDKLV
jgi:hypothetical protein